MVQRLNYRFNSLVITIIVVAVEHSESGCGGMTSHTTIDHVCGLDVMSSLLTSRACTQLLRVRREFIHQMHLQTQSVNFVLRFFFLLFNIRRERIEMGTRPNDFGFRVRY